MRRGCIVSMAALMALFMVSPGMGAFASEPTDAQTTSSENKYALLIGSYSLQYLDEVSESKGLIKVTDGDYTKPTIAGFGQTPYFADVPFTNKDVLVNEFGWLEENIMFLYEEDATKENIMAGLMWLLDHDEEGNILFVGWEMHGSFVVPSDVQRDAWFGAIPDDEPSLDEMVMAYDSDPFAITNWIYDDELRYLFGGDELKGTWVWLFGSCYSEGLGDDFQGKNKVILCACSEKEMSTTADPETGQHLFEYYILSALQGETGESFWYCDLNMNPDSNGDGSVSVEEAFYWTQTAMEHTDESVFTYGAAYVHPVMFDGLEGEAHL